MRFVTFQNNGLAEPGEAIADAPDFLGRPHSGVLMTLDADNVEARMARAVCNLSQ